MKTLCTVFSIVLLAGCATQDQEVHLTADFADFAKGAALTWNDAWAAGDAMAIGNQYAEDAMILPPNSDPIEGRQAIQEYWAAAIAGGPNSSITSVESGSNGDLAFERGTYTVDGPNGEHFDHGKYLVVWKLVNDNWKIYRDTWNSSVPAPESGDMDDDSGM